MMLSSGGQESGRNALEKALVCVPWVDMLHPEGSVELK